MSSSSSALCNSKDDFEVIDEIEWGPSRDDPDYDTDQELAPRPRKRAPDRCNCCVSEEEIRCLDQSCIIFSSMEECGKMCPAGDSCGNRRLQLRNFPKMEVFDAGPKGKGLRILEPTTKGTVINEYIGRALVTKSIDRTFRRYQLDRRLYILKLSNDIYLDARTKGSLARYMNHSCDPNCLVERWTVKGILRAAVIALRDIEAGEELCFDYQWTRAWGRAPTVCHCKSQNCRGTLEVAKSLEETDIEAALEGHWEEGKLVDQTLVNRVVRVFSPERNEYAVGEVTGFDAATGKHCIVYHHDMTSESWVDLRQEKFMVLDSKINKNSYIAKKVQQDSVNEDSERTLLRNERPTNGNESCPNFLIVQTDAKNMLLAKRWLDRLERAHGVHFVVATVSKQQAMESTGPERVSMLRALAESPDGVVWKIAMKGPNFPVAYEKLQGALMQGERDATQNETEAVEENDTEVYSQELIFPRTLVDLVKRHLGMLHEKFKKTKVDFASSESKSKQFSRLVIEGSNPKERDACKAHLWSTMVSLCNEMKVPMVLAGVPHGLGFLGGSISKEQFDSLRAGEANDLSLDAFEDWNNYGFIQSFQAAGECSVWIQKDEDWGKIRKNQVVADDFGNSRKVFIGCPPERVASLFHQLQRCLSDMTSGVKYLPLGKDKKLLLHCIEKHNPQFFDFLESVTNCSVSIDTVTGDHVRFECKTFSGRTDALDLAADILRTQIECFRDKNLRESYRMFGRNWCNMELTDVSTPPGGLSLASAALAGRYVEAIVNNLGVPKSIGGHAITILYRCAAEAVSRNDTSMKQRDTAVACVFLACKCYKGLGSEWVDRFLEVSYQAFYPGSEVRQSNDDVSSQVEKIVTMERLIVEMLQYDVFWEGCEHLIAELSSVCHGKEGLTVERVLEVAFSGPVLSSGAKLWLVVGVNYIVAATTVLLGVPIGMTISRMKSLTNIEKFCATLSALCEAIVTYGDSQGLSPRKLKAKQEQLQGLVQNATNEASTITLGQHNSNHDVCFSFPLATEGVQDSQLDELCAFYDIDVYLKVTESDTIAEVSGEWREVIVAGSELPIGDVSAVSQSTLTTSASSLDGYKFEQKDHPGLIGSQQVSLCDGSRSSVEESAHLSLYRSRLDAKEIVNTAKRVGGKNCTPGTVMVDALSKAGLRWWMRKPAAVKPCGSLDLGYISSCGLDERRSKLHQISDSVFVHGNSRSWSKALPVTLQRWPPNKIEAKESLRKTDFEAGLSSAALEELQTIKELHGGLGRGHHNVVLPVAIAIPNRTDTKKEESSEDNGVFSILKSSQENDKAAHFATRKDSRPHIICKPIALTLQRVMGRKLPSDDDHVSPDVLLAWCHDLLTLVSRCHSRGLVLRSLQTEDLFLSHAGVLKLGSMYRTRRLSVKERINPISIEQMIKRLRSVSKKTDQGSTAPSSYETPEVLLGLPNKARPECDIWAVGTIVASLMINRHLFGNAKDRQSLLLAQYKVVGAPSSKNFPLARKLPFYEKPQKPYKEGVEKALSHMLKDRAASFSVLIDLVGRMLRLDPRERISVSEALQHECMVSYRRDHLENAEFRQRFVKGWRKLRYDVLTARDKTKVRDDSGKKRRVSSESSRALKKSKKVQEEVDDLYDIVL